MTATTTDTKPGRPRKISDALLSRVQRMYEDGHSVPKIAAMPWCNVSAQTLYYHLAGRSPVGDGQVEMRARGRKGLSNEQLSRAVFLHGEGYTVSAIREELAKDEAKARKCALSAVKRFAAKTVSDALKEAGCEVRRGRPPKPAAE